MKNLSETTKKIKELSALTGEDDDALLRRVGAHLLRKITGDKQSVKNALLQQVGAHPAKIKITIEYDFTRSPSQSV